MTGLVLGIVAARASAASNTVYNVTSYGAVGDGVTDNTNAVANAINAAQSNGGGTVYFPAGTYAFTQKLGAFAPSMQIHGAAPITFAGDGNSSTALVEHVAGQALLSVHTDGTILQDMTLDTQTYNGGVAVGIQANNTTLQRASVLGGSNKFALYYTGPPGAKPTAPLYNTGNQVLNTTISDQFNGDGFSFSFQQNALIQNIVHTGSRLALYVDSNVTVDGDQYTPGPQKGGTDGFWLTPPSTGITINNFQTAGRGGVIGAGNPKVSTNITISNESFEASSGYHLDVANVNGLTISGGWFNAANTLRFDPGTSATNVTVQNTTVPAIRFAQPSSASIDITFTDCTFPALVLKGKPAPTFQNQLGGPTTVTVNGGTWSNQAGKWFKGTNTTFTVSNLTGYP